MRHPPLKQFHPAGLAAGPGETMRLEIRGSDTVAPALSIPDLSTLAEAINTEHTQAEAAMREGLTHALRCGELLTQAKELVKHGDWLAWLSENCTVSERSAQSYMRVYQNWPELSKSATVADLTYRGALAMLSEPKTEQNAMSEVEAKQWLQRIEDEILSKAGAFLEVGEYLKGVRGRVEDSQFAAMGFDKALVEAHISTHEWYQDRLRELNSEGVTLEQVLQFAREGRELQNGWAELRLQLMRKVGHLMELYQNQAGQA